MAAAVQQLPVPTLSKLPPTLKSRVLERRKEPDFYQGRRLLLVS